MPPTMIGSAVSDDEAVEALALVWRDREAHPGAYALVRCGHRSRVQEPPSGWRGVYHADRHRLSLLPATLREVWGPSADQMGRLNALRKLGALVCGRANDLGHSARIPGTLRPLHVYCFEREVAREIRRPNQISKGGVRHIGPVTMPWQYSRWTYQDVDRLVDATIAGLVPPHRAVNVAGYAELGGVDAKLVAEIRKAAKRAMANAEAEREGRARQLLVELGGEVRPQQVTNVARLSQPRHPPQVLKHPDRPLCLSCAGGCALGPVPWPKWVGGHPPPPPPYPAPDDPEVIAERERWQAEVDGPLERRWNAKRRFTPPGRVCEVTGRSGPCWRDATPDEVAEEISDEMRRIVHQRRIHESRVEYDAALRMYYDQDIRDEIARKAAKEVCGPCLAIHVDAKCKAINQLVDQLGDEINQRSSQ